MRLSLEVVQQGLEWDDILMRVRRAEAAGFDGAWTFDHFRPIGGDQNGPCLEGWTLLAALAASTSRIRLGTLVTGMTYRPPGILAAEAITVDHISHGRLEIGLGAGWFEAEHRELGVPFPPVRERAQRLDEGIQVLRLLMTEEGATFNGLHYHLDNATFQPRPVQRPAPPIWIGAAGERVMLRIVARQADVWHASAPLDDMRRKSALLDRYAEEAGRDPAAIARAGSVQLGSPDDEIRRTAEGFRKSGFSHLVCVWPPGGLQRIEQFAASLLPELQAL